MGAATHELRLFASHLAMSNEDTPEQINDDHRGVLLLIDISDVGVAIVDLFFQGKDPVTGAWFDLADVSGLSTNGKRKWVIRPGVTTSGTVRRSDMAVPKRWRIHVAVTGAVTYSLSAVMIP